MSSNQSTGFAVAQGAQDVTLTRVFDAPRELVFAVMTDPKHIPSWWGPEQYETIVDVYEPRPGGRWRFLHRDADGNEFAFHGVIHECTVDRVVQTFEFEGMPGHVLLETVTLEEADGRTTLTNQSVFQSVADRDGMVASGMTDGASESMDRLAQLLAAQ